MHEYMPLAVTLIAIFAGILLNRRDYGLLREDMNQRFDRVDKRLDRIDNRLDRVGNDLREFYGSNRKLEGRVDELSRGK